MVAANFDVYCTPFNENKKGVGNRRSMSAFITAFTRAGCRSALSAARIIFNRFLFAWLKPGVTPTFLILLDVQFVLGRTISVVV